MTQGEQVAALTRRQQRGLAALLSSPSIAAAARSSGIPHVTIRRWLRSLDFRATYDHERQVAYSQAVGLAQSSAGVAVGVLVTIVGDESEKGAARVSAARAILELGNRAELDALACRIAALEEIAGKEDTS